MRRSTIVRSTTILVPLMIIFWTTLCCSSVQCFFLSALFRNMQGASTYTAQPITLKVPKHQINDLKEAIQTNPGYLKQLLSQSASPNGIGQTIPLPPAGVGRSTGLSNFPSYPNSYPSIGQNPITVALPTVTTIGGQQFYLTSRASLLWNRGANLLRNAATAIASPLSTTSMPMGYAYNKILPNQGYVPKLNTNKNANINIPEEDEEEEEEEEYEEEEEEEEEEKQSTKKPKNKDGRNKNKIKNFSSPEESSEEENSSEEEEKQSTKKLQNKDGSNKNKNKTYSSPEESSEAENSSDEEDTRSTKKPKNNDRSNKNKYKKYSSPEESNEEENDSDEDESEEER